MILALLVSAATIGWGASTASAEHDAVPAPIVTQADGHGTIWEASNSCYYPNCTAAHQAGEGDIPSNSPHYCNKQDRDGDGISCEW
jgi:hypothetical protein